MLRTLFDLSGEEEKLCEVEDLAALAGLSSQLTMAGLMALENEGLAEDDGSRRAQPRVCALRGDATYQALGLPMPWLEVRHEPYARERCSALAERPLLRRAERVAQI